MTKNRRLDHLQGKKVLCVGAVVLKQNRILFVRQAPGHTLAGKWSIPWGIVEESESPEHAALRETLEESGVTAKMTGLIGIQNLEDASWLALVFLCRHIKGQPAPDMLETDDSDYLSHKDMKNPDRIIEPWCKWLANRIFRGQYRITPPQSRNPYEPKIAFL